MLSATAVGLILVWILALTFSVTLGGWIHLLPLAAAPMLLARFMRHDRPSAEYTKWELAHARRRLR